MLFCFLYRKDWGALILVDARYAKGAHYTKGTTGKCVGCTCCRSCVDGGSPPGLSKWVRQRVRHEGNFQQSIVSLKSFVECMLREDSMDTSVNDSKSSIRYAGAYLGGRGLIDAHMQLKVLYTS